jgi:hypothetical protein
VQSREYLEQRRLNQTVREAQSAALALKEDVKPTELLGYALQLSSGRVRSLSQWKLYDPALHTLEHGMRDGDAADLDLETVGGLIAQSEIDFGALRANIRATLEEQSQASIRCRPIDPEYSDACPRRETLALRGEVLGSDSRARP